MKPYRVRMRLRGQLHSDLVATFHGGLEHARHYADMMNEKYAPDRFYFVEQEDDEIRNPY